MTQLQADSFTTLDNLFAQLAAEASVSVQAEGAFTDMIGKFFGAIGRLFDSLFGTKPIPPPEHEIGGLDINLVSANRQTSGKAAP